MVASEKENNEWRKVIIDSTNRLSIYQQSISSIDITDNENKLSYKNSWWKVNKARCSNLLSTLINTSDSRSFSISVA